MAQGVQVIAACTAAALVVCEDQVPLVLGLTASWWSRNDGPASGVPTPVGLRLEEAWCIAYDTLGQRLDQWRFSRRNMCSI